MLGTPYERLRRGAHLSHLVLLLTCAQALAAGPADYTARVRALYASESDFERAWPVEFHIRVVEPMAFALAESAKYGGQGLDVELFADTVNLVWAAQGVSGTLPLGIRHTPWQPQPARTVARDAFVRQWQTYLTAFKAVHYAELKLKQGIIDKPGVFSVKAQLHVAGVGQSGEIRDDNGQVSLVFEQRGETWKITRLSLDDVATDTRPAKMFDPANDLWLSQAGVPAQKLLTASASDAIHRSLLGGSAPADLRLTPLAMDAHPGAVVVDIDADGFDDLLVWDVTGPATLLHNNAGQNFTDDTARFGLNVRDISAAVFADLDNDGAIDVVVGRWLTPATIAYGKRDSAGALSFAQGESTDTWLLPQNVATLSVADINRDGLLDLFVGTAANDFHAQAVAKDARLLASTDVNVNQLGPGSYMLVNHGARHFEDATESVGLSLHRNTLQASFADFNGDGWPDVFIGNDFAPANLFLNRAGHFVDVSHTSGADRVLFGMGASWADFDNDGDLDLYASAMSSTAGKRIMSNPNNFAASLNASDKQARKLAARGNTLLKNDGATFSDATDAAAFDCARDAHWAYGAQFFDIDNDGWLDIYAPNGFFTSSVPPPDGTPRELCSDYWRGVTVVNPKGNDLGFGPPSAATMSFSGPERDKVFVSKQGRGFADASYLSGLDSPLDGRGFAYADFDHDGALDVVLVSRNAPVISMFRNRTASAQRHWVSVDLQGDGQVNNRDAIGSRVTVSCGKQRFTRYRDGGTGFATQNSRALSFGLGPCQTALEVQVVWPNGAVSRYANVHSDAAYKIDGAGLHPVWKAL